MTAKRKKEDDIESPSISTPPMKKVKEDDDDDETSSKGGGEGQETSKKPAPKQPKWTDGEEVALLHALSDLAKRNGTALAKWPGLEARPKQRIVEKAQGLLARMEKSGKLAI